MAPPAQVKPDVHMCAARLTGNVDFTPHWSKNICEVVREGWVSRMYCPPSESICPIGSGRTAHATTVTANGSRSQRLPAVGRERSHRSCEWLRTILSPGRMG